MYEFWQHRNRHVSSSVFGQYVHERVRPDFDSVDIDLLNRAASTAILRFLEQKESGQNLKDSQVRCFPVIARLIELGLEQGVVAQGSGVFKIDWSDDEIMKALRGKRCATPQRFQIMADGTVEQLPELHATEFHDWLRCRT